MLNAVLLHFSYWITNKIQPSTTEYINKQTNRKLKMRIINFKMDTTIITVWLLLLLRIHNVSKIRLNLIKTFSRFLIFSRNSSK